MAGSDHVRPIRLFDISQGKGKPSEAEREHVRNCGECQTVIAIFVRQFGSHDPSKDNPENAA
jgi:hypothetical protein